MKILRFIAFKTCPVKNSLTINLSTNKNLFVFARNWNNSTTNSTHKSITARPVVCRCGKLISPSSGQRDLARRSSCCSFIKSLLVGEQILHHKSLEVGLLNPQVFNKVIAQYLCGLFHDRVVTHF